MAVIRNLPLRFAAALLPCAALLAGCNLFNPTGTHKTSDLGVDAKIMEAERLLRDKENARAERLFQEAIRSDSTKSRAYFGLAKAQLRVNEVNTALVLDFVKSFEATKSGEPGALVAMKYMRSLSDENVEGISEALVTLEALGRRDKLQALRDSTGEIGDRYTAADYPLTDGKVDWNRIALDVDILTAAKAFQMLSGMTGGLDCLPFLDPACDVSKAQFFVDAVSDSAVTGLANMALDTLSTYLANVEALSFQMLNASREGVIGLVADSTGMEESAIQSSVDSLETAVRYYRFADGEDNDGDGCVDEEILDGIDNDGDGLKDEDLRVSLKDLIDNDRNGAADDDGEKLDSDGMLFYYKDFLAAGKIGPEYRNLLVRNAIVLDADGTAYPLEKRRELVGACWWNIDSLK